MRRLLWFLNTAPAPQMARLTPGVMILIGCGLLIGWGLGGSVFQTLFTGGGNLQVWVALGLLLSGLALGLLQQRASTLSRLEQDRLKNQEIIRQQLAEIEAIYHTAPVGLAILDRDLRFVRLNQRLAEINGLSPTEHVGRTVAEIVPDLADEVEPLLRQVITTGEPLLNLEVNGETAAQPGVQRTWIENWYPLRDAEGQVMGINAVVQEITQRKQAEAALQEANQRIVAIWDSMTDAYTTLDQDWRIIYANATSLRLMGQLANCEPTDIVGKSHWEAFPWTIGQPLEQEYRRAMAEQVPVHLEVLYEPTGGWFEIHAYPSTLGLGLYYREITERKQAELLLRDKEQQLRQLSDSMPQFVWISTAEGELEYVNRRWCDYSGLTLEQSRDPAIVAAAHHPDEVEHLFAQWTTAVETRCTFEIEGRLRSVDGDYRWFLMRSVPILDQQGQVQRWYGTSTDIHDRKQLEDILAAQAEELKRTNQLKDEFLAVLSHELRTPLHPILGWTQMMRMQKLTPAETAEALEIIERNAKHQAALVNDLLDVSRIIQGKLNLTLYPIDLAEVVTHALGTVQLTAQTKHIEIQVQAGSPLLVMGDADRLQQVFWNLLSNAIKFTPEGGSIQVDWSMTVDENASRYAQVRITDSGIGIQPEFLPYVFDHFRQADGSITREYGGLGLGLSIVRHLVELHGGRVTVASRGENQGATFTVQLPLCVETDVALTDAELDWLTSMPSTAPDSLTGIKILLLDDELDNLDLLCFLLQHQGAVVTPLTSPLEALDWIAAHPPDLIISDISMPKLNGYDLIRQVRTLPQGRAIPALALTAFAQPEYQNQAIEAGFQAALAKPVDPLALLAAIDQLLQR